jgi:hypothetical protein
VPFHGDGTSATQVPPSEVVPDRLVDVAADESGTAASENAMAAVAIETRRRRVRAPRIDRSRRSELEP